MLNAIDQTAMARQRKRTCSISLVYYIGYFAACSVVIVNIITHDPLIFTFFNIGAIIATTPCIGKNGHPSIRVLQRVHQTFVRRLGLARISQLETVKVVAPAKAQVIVVTRDVMIGPVILNFTL